MNLKSSAHKLVGMVVVCCVGVGNRSNAQNPQNAKPPATEREQGQPNSVSTGSVEFDRIIELLGKGETTSATKTAEKLLQQRRKDAGEEAESTAEAEYLLGKCLQSSHDFAKALKLFQSGEQKYRKLGQSMNAVWLLGAQGDCNVALKKIDQALKNFEECVKQSETLNQPLGVAQHSKRLGHTLYGLERYEEAVAAFEKANRVFGEINQCHESAIMKVWRGNALRKVGKADEAIKDYKLAAEILESLANDESLSPTLSDLGVLLFKQRKYDDALKVFQKAEKCCLRLRNESEAAEMVGWQGDCWNRLDNDEEAAKAYQACVEVLKKHDNEGALSINALNLGRTLYRLMRLEKAITAFNMAKASYEKLGSDQDVAEALGGIGAIQFKLKRIPEAEATFRLQIERLEQAKNIGPNHLAVAKALGLHFSFYLLQENFPAAEECLVRKIRILKNDPGFGRDHAETASDIQTLATIYNVQEKYDLAGQMYDQAYKIRRKILGPTHKDTLESLHSLVSDLSVYGNVDRARKLCETALEDIKADPKSDPLDEAYASHALGKMLMMQSNLVDAKRLLDRAFEIRSKKPGVDNAKTLAIVDSLASLAMLQGDFLTAETFYLQILGAKKSQVPQASGTGLILCTLAELYRHQSRYAEAEEHLNRGIALIAKDDVVHRLLIPVLEFQLGTIQLALGKRDNAIRNLQQANKAIEARYGPDSLLTSTCDRVLANAYEGAGQHDQATPYFERALKTIDSKLGLDHPQAITLLNDLALIRWRQHHPLESREFAIRAVNASREFLERTSAIQSEQQQIVMAAVGTARESLNACLTVTSDGEQAEVVWNAVMPWKGLITSRQTRIRREMRKDPLWERYLRVQTEFSGLILNPPEPIKVLAENRGSSKNALQRLEEWQSRNKTLQAELTELEQKLSAKSSSFRRSMDEQKVTGSKIKDSLSSQKSPTALVDLFVYNHAGGDGGPAGERLAAFVVRPDRNIARVNLARPMHEFVTNLFLWRGERRGSDGRITIASPGTGTEGIKSANWLREHLWIPLEKNLDGIKTVLVCPDGQISQLPWAALPGAKPGTYLLEEDRMFAIVPIPQSLPKLLSTEPNRRLPASLLLVGDINYDSPPGKTNDPLAVKESVFAGQRSGGWKKFERLPASQPEMASIQDRFERKAGKGKLLQLRSRDDDDVEDPTVRVPTESEFRLQATGFEWLHVITHGFFTPTSVRSIVQSPRGELPAPTHVQRAGIGAMIQFQENVCTIANVVAGGAAEQDGRLQAGDQILFVADSRGDWVAPTPDNSLVEIVNLILGPVGSTVRLKVRLKNRTDEMQIQLTRGRLPEFVSVHPGLLSGLVFAGANRAAEADKDDGILTALDVSGLNLSQVNTVVLSACETGLGEVAGGEGLLGLQRAFQVAGVKTCATSLWKVSDRATMTLMQRFYENLWDKKMGKLAALREAQIWMLRDEGNRGLVIVEQPAASRELPPFYWAAFVLSGDWR